MGSFTVQNMLGSQALVTGTDSMGNSGQCVVSTEQWDELKALQQLDVSKEAFDAAVTEFFQPLLDMVRDYINQNAAEDMAQAAKPEPDALSYVVLHEGREAVAGEDDEVVELTRDSIILRAIEEGSTDRLVWVDETTLGILASS